MNWLRIGFLFGPELTKNFWIVNYILDIFGLTRRAEIYQISRI